MGEEGRPRGMGDLTEMLISCGQGDRAALDALLPLVYDELRVIAWSYLRQERSDHTLQPTGFNLGVGPLATGNAGALARPRPRRCFSNAK